MIAAFAPLSLHRRQSWSEGEEGSRSWLCWECGLRLFLVTQ